MCNALATEKYTSLDKLRKANVDRLLERHHLALVDEDDLRKALQSLILNDFPPGLDKIWDKGINL